jgi:uncharacterized membrane protein
MMLLHAPAPPALAILGWLIVVSAVVRAARSVRGDFLRSSTAQHAWLAAVVTVALLWTMHVRSPVGMDFGLLGSALFALVFGRARAVLGLVAALVLYTALEGRGWFNAGINAIVLGLVPAWLATALQRQIEQRLPKNLFVFIIGNGLFATLAATACANSLVLALSALESAGVTTAFGDHLAYSLLLAWGEALISGMLFSALVVFTPRAVFTYRQDVYLPPRRPLA